jgi:8-oxo-dGTP pyrophosphatase MutT (NUDIX family)
MDLKERIRTALAAHDRIAIAAGHVPAAVLLPLYRKEGQCHVLFTKRTEHLHHHRGEISFPGGVRHPEDRDMLETALRETLEETGIVPTDVDILGTLDTIYSVYDYDVTPFVGFLPDDYRFTINPDEIERTIEVPLDHLLRPEIFREEDWTWKGRRHPVCFYTYGDDEIWGLTAAILKQFLDLVFPGSEATWQRVS